MLCITIAHEEKWVNVIDNKVLGVSKHVDYALFHWKAHDVKALKVAVTKFIYVDADNAVIEVILADQLKERGCNFKTAKRDGAELTEVEQWEVAAAIELARAPMKKEQPKPPKATAAATPPTEEQKPAGDAPKVFLSPEGAAAGLGDILGAQADQPDVEADSETAAPEGEGADTPPADIALPTVKPSRTANKKRRR